MNTRTWMRTLTLVALASTLMACSSTPAARGDEGREAPALPTDFAAAASLPRGTAEALRGWAALGDAELTALVQRGLAANLDLRQAAERVQRARALAAGAAAARGPSLSATLGGRSQQLAEAQAPWLTRDQRRSDTVQAGLDLAWEVDLFGRLKGLQSAAEARATGTEADAQALGLAVGAEIAQAWYGLASARERQQLTRDVIENRRATLELVRRRVVGGYSASLDEARARADLAAAEADLPALDAEIAAANHRLAVLLGELPGGFQIATPPLPAVGVRLAVPAPAQWLSTRPDLRAAEARLRALGLDVEAVRAEFYPRLTVSGFLGFVAGTASGLGATGSTSWLLVPALSMPLYDSGRIAARLDAARAAEREALLHYRQRVLLAVEEVENALTRVAQGARQLQALHERDRQASLAEGLARRRYEAGASDLLELLDAQRSAYQARLGLAQALLLQQQQVVAALRALAVPITPEPA